MTTKRDDEDAVLVLSLADALGVRVRAEHLAEVAAAWRLMRPHLQAIQAADLAPTDEPAALFRA